uniref:Thioredoxin domain-containing protein n=1 Tax=Acrobeloides nanus TaxID=290746 RepID=A0A914CFU6_9BILA
MSQLLADVPLKRKDGSSVDVEQTLQGKVVALYFSAHWCPPCRKFTPILRDFYDEITDDEDFEIVFVSKDTSEAELQNYLSEAHGNWLYVPFGHDKIDDLAKRYNIAGIPSLIVIKPDGTVISENGRSEIESKPPKKAFADWKAKL